MIDIQTETPHIIKYMGSKRSIIDFVVNAILDNSTSSQRLYDLFGGSAVVAGALRNEMPVTCNDIQKYTTVPGKLYLQNYYWNDYPEDILDIIIEKANSVYQQNLKYIDTNGLLYDNAFSYEEVAKVESNSQALLNAEFSFDNHLFVKNYSGTYWSFEQCLWIDSLSSIARSSAYRDTFIYSVILSSLMFAMSYCSQSTGHYAQHRVLTPDNVKDVLMYRKKSILKLFKQKFKSLKDFYDGSSNTQFSHELKTMDFTELLKSSIPGSIIYADPPYQFVHYSRFYHALETLVKYDYPIVQHKGRYRADRHQSPFCITSKVKKAFEGMFKIISEKRSTLILSYSHTGMISLEDIRSICAYTFENYTTEIQELDYKHSTMGRSGDKSRNVKEILVIIKPN
jgi:adenine-specific DNA-methyltransferase